MKKLDKLTASVKLSIRNPKSKSDSLFGRGIAELCRGIRELGSLNAAAKSMGMAYSKAWRIVKETEAALGFQLLNRDGAHGSTLTAEGDKLLDAYTKVSKAMDEKAQAAYLKAVK